MAGAELPEGPAAGPVPVAFVAVTGALAVPLVGLDLFVGLPPAWAVVPPPPDDEV